MPVPLAGPGQVLPLPQYLYPSQLPGVPIDVSTNEVCLAPGESLVVPAGDWYISLGMYCIFQYLDPLTNTWTVLPTAGWNGGNQLVTAGGYNPRVANMLGCPLSAVGTAGGSLYVQSAMTVVAVGSNSTWVPIVGGALAVSG